MEAFGGVVVWCGVCVCVCVCVCGVCVCVCVRHSMVYFEHYKEMTIYRASLKVQVPV